MTPIGSETRAGHRLRAFGYFVIAGVYFFFALVVAHSVARLFPDIWSELAERAILLLLLLSGYGLMARAFDGQRKPFAAMGLVIRPGWGQEFGRGAALGWGMLVASILPMALLGGLIVGFWTGPRQFLMIGFDLLVLAVASLGEEVAFRGYPFQRLIEAIGPTLATLVLSILFGMAHLFNPGASGTSIVVTIFCGWLLSIAYLRTRALWFSWGWHFAWNASMGVLFGLPISGLTRFSPVIQSYTIGPAWITGSDYGPEASLVAAIVILVGIIVLFRITRDYAYRYTQPVIVPGGIPVDLDAMNRVLAPHHALRPDPGAAPTKETLVTIDGASNPAAKPAEESASPQPLTEPNQTSNQTEDGGPRS